MAETSKVETNPYVMRIQGRDVPYRIETLDPMEIQLDPRNPRLQYLLRHRGGTSVSDEQLEEILWDRDATKALAEQIRQNGGVYEPIIVHANGDGIRRVREGNTRVVACRRKRRADPTNTAYTTIPAMIFDGKLTDEDVAVIMAGDHVSGKTRWDAYEQAKHVHDLHDLYGKSHEWLATELRLSKAKVGQQLAAFKATSGYLEGHPDPANVSKFTFFFELMRKKELRTLWEVSTPGTGFQEMFTRWITDGQLTEAKQVRELPAILAVPAALQALDREGFQAAHEALVRQDPSRDSSLFAAVKDATLALKNAPVSDVQDLSANPAKILLLKNLRRAIDDLGLMAGVQVN